MYDTILMFIKLKNFGSQCLMRPDIYFIHSAGLPAMYLSLACMYMSLALIQIHIVTTDTIICCPTQTQSMSTFTVFPLQNQLSVILSCFITPVVLQILWTRDNYNGLTSAKLPPKNGDGRLKPIDVNKEVDKINILLTKL